ncbi:MAG: bifunctional diguanylate cyclase/phosphodiesterase [Idiomarina sp.]|nr:bifunctional diguanylate cyclase/phosphodiesterase [Idiomarina sp.]
MGKEGALKWGAFLNLISELSSRFVGSSCDDTDRVVNAALTDIGVWFNADRAYVFRFFDSYRGARNSHEWCGPSIEPQIDYLQHLNTEVLSCWMTPFQAGETVHIPDVTQLPPGDGLALLESQDIKSVLMIPMMTDAGLIGMFGVDHVSAKRHWSDEEIAAMQLIAGNISSLFQRHDAETKAQELLYKDTLTGLPNRRSMREQIRRVIEQLQREGGHHALVLMDLDQFTEMNERLGFVSGDWVLQQCGQRLTKHRLNGDIVARMGSDEFALLMTNLAKDPEQALNEVRRRCDALHRDVAMPFSLPVGHEEVTVSLGVALIDRAITDAETPVKHAELALNKAKGTAGHAIQFFDERLQLFSGERSQLLHELRQAIQHEELQLYFQPILSGREDVLGVEALARWPHPERGLVMPADFIGLAESSGYIVSLGRLVLTQACRQLQAWSEDSALKGLSMSVNVSISQFRDPSFAYFVESLLDQYPVATQLLRLEVTESLLALNLSDVITTMRRLSKRGVRFSLDDFGTGYSSLTYLRTLPLSQLKIDRSFIKDISARNKDMTIASAIAALGKSLKLEVVAEGVETLEQLDALRQLKNVWFQGFYYAKPLPAADLATFVKENSSRNSVA